MRFVYFETDNKHVNTMFAELYKTNNVIILDGRTKEPKNIVSRVLRKIHLSRKINSIVQLPFKRIWARTPLTFKQPIENEEYCVLFIDNIPQFIDFSLLNLAREKYGIKIVLFLLNPATLSLIRFFRMIITMLKNMDSAI